MKPQHIILIALVSFGIWAAYSIYGPNGYINAPYEPHASKNSEPKKPSSAQENTAKQAVKLKLKDPESAQFRNLILTMTGDVCGEVNAKNGFGGYTGFKMFQVTEKGAYVEKEPLGSDEDVALINQSNELTALMCGRSSSSKE